MQENVPLFTKLYHEWFSNRKFWFDKNEMYDKYLSEKYFCKISLIEYEDDLFHEDVKTLIGAIIAYDQIPRHHKRINKIDSREYSKIAAEVSLMLMSRLSADVVLYKSISAYEWCFILLPHRHIKDLDRINTIIRFVIEKHNNVDTCDEDKKIFKKFLHSTINKAHKENTAMCLQAPHTIRVASSYEHWKEFHSVLEHCPFLDIQKDDDQFKFMKAFKSFKEGMPDAEESNIIVSISGGVSSCVCLFLARLFDKNNRICAVYINYSNSNCSDGELGFIQRYCSALGVNLYCRTIHEMQRSDCQRNGLKPLYEDITRAIRFDTYTQVAKIFFKNSKQPHILLGHHMDDCLNNIITNIGIKKSYSNLAGITKHSTAGSANLWRPLIDVKENDVRDFAYAANIPFLASQKPISAAASVPSSAFQSFFALNEYVMASNDIIDICIVSLLDKEFTCSPEEGTAHAVLTKDALVPNTVVWARLFDRPRFSFISHKKLHHTCVQSFVKFLERFLCRFDSTQINKRHGFVLSSSTDCILRKSGENKIAVSFISSQKD